MNKLSDEQLHYLKESLREIDFGLVQLTIHDGRVTQIDTTEKRRFSLGQKGLTKK